MQVREIKIKRLFVATGDTYKQYDSFVVDVFNETTRLSTVVGNNENHFEKMVDLQTKVRRATAVKKAMTDRPKVGVKDPDEFDFR